ncbi:MAG TPA: hypothetical protein VJS43_18540 [Candidatus Acidoferrales bacterium]|nr:hypothetical protein [Candidatus Acidoferrales bacterium]
MLAIEMSPHVRHRLNEGFPLPSIKTLAVSGRGKHMSNRGKGFAAIVFGLILAVPSPAQSFLSAQHERARPLGRIWHYIVTHKEVLAADAIAVSAWSADAASTVYDQHHCACIETNSLLGKHPSEGAIWTYGIGGAAVQVSLNHLIWHYAPDHADRHLMWFELTPLVGNEVFNVYSNVQAADIAPLSKQHSNTSGSYGRLKMPSQFSLGKF